ncbi:MAG TPA: SigE family RNA polymerase sigma factor [Pseudonocardia sp.]|uniref:SigE family RNA polymerase sigma factor n=1 Tax=Pseudonocardia sp. TaxID=60912 RepID=UPI002BADD571|nr:SigE family RNA polymerase sigma factor [Pseudonocardia sp.]HTF50867.1 SigE family RNA polymerase sigma factor [Pseudonocardia sp.]
MDEAAEQAFEQYFRTRREAVRRNAYLLCGDWHHADDLAQAAFVTLHRKWHTIREPAAVDAYLRRVLVRTLIDETRRPWRRERAVPRPPESIATDGTSEQVATRQTLIAALRQLPPRQRAVLVLRFLEGMDVAATARAMGCREGTVKSQTAHGLAALRGVLGSALDDLRPAG